MVVLTTLIDCIIHIKATERDTEDRVALKKIKMEKETNGFPITVRNSRITVINISTLYHKQTMSYIRYIFYNIHYLCYILMLYMCTLCIGYS